MRLGALILAGGRSVRMGRPKEWLPFGDDTLLGRISRTLLEVAAPVLVLARDHEQELPLLPHQVETLVDERREAGPLAGLAQGLDHLVTAHGFEGTDALLLTACDLPFLDAAFVRGLMANLDGHDVVLPITAGREEPLAAIYRIHLRSAASELVRRGLGSPRALAAAANTCRLADEALTAIDPVGRCLWNLNTQADYERAQAILRD